MALKITVIVLLGLIVALYVGLKIQPASFPVFAEQDGPIEYIPIPNELPTPVENFYHQMYGKEVPVIESAVITGKVRMRPVGPVTFPGRFRFTHNAGHNYRHYIEATLFGLPLLKVNESYIGGEGRMELPFGVVENEPKINQASNLGLWAESLWLPSVFLTDPRVRWEEVDDEAAWLIVPFEDEEDRFLVRFHSETKLPTLFEAMRYKDADADEKTLWICEAVEWRMMNGKLAMGVGTLTWFGDKGPWAVFSVEEISYNVDVEDYMLGRGI